MRIESGAVQFEGDHPGVFIRGDNALALAMYLQTTLAEIEHAGLRPRYISYQKRLIYLLQQCDAGSKDCNPLQLKSAEECKVA